MRIRKPNPKYANTALIENNGIRELSTYEEVAQSKEGKDVMKEEMKVLKQNETWKLVPQPIKYNPFHVNRCTR